MLAFLRHNTFLLFRINTRAERKSKYILRLELIFSILLLYNPFARSENDFSCIVKMMNAHANNSQAYFSSKACYCIKINSCTIIITQQSISFKQKRRYKNGKKSIIRSIAGFINIQLQSASP